MNRIDIVVIDDHTMLRGALCESLLMEDDLRVVADTSSGALGVKLVARHRPHLVLLDVEIPGEDVSVTLAALFEASPATRVLILSMHGDRQLIRELLAGGAAGYVHKSATRADLLSVIRSVATDSGDAVVVAGAPEPVGEHRSAAEEVLTLREFEVIDLVAGAKTNRQISVELGITEGTVKRHLRNIFDKLGAVSRLDAVNRARTLPRPTGARRG
ncbi:response regulator transcription factor [Nocardia sp. 2]|uniref:Response regulator transcription factor n=1 Tax=Nocardia acididurans TaxID=2802282 RepID=A0ABS1MCM0_9NOCA|nr:response regulator transcription factor [Nocardia acididurans]MBL1078311.1 response regulator transcription factor [Nocardia acididurans]